MTALKNLWISWLGTRYGLKEILNFETYADYEKFIKEKPAYADKPIYPGLSFVNESMPWCMVLNENLNDDKPMRKIEDL